MPIDTCPTVKTITTLGRTIPIKFDASGKGKFYALVADSRHEAPSLQALVDKVKRAVKALGKISIPVTVVRDHYDEDPPEFTDYRIVGYRPRRGPVGVDGDGHERVIDRYDGHLCRQLTPDEREEYLATTAAKRAAEQKLEALLEAWAIDAAAAIEQAAHALDGTEPDPAVTEEE